MGNCGSKSGAKDVVSTPRKADLKNGAFKYDENNKKIVYIGDDNRSEATSKGDIGASTSASVTSEESSPSNNRTDSASKQSLLGEIAEYLEDDVSTIATEKRGSPSINGRQNINQHQGRTTDTRSQAKDKHGPTLQMKKPLIVSPLQFEGEIDNHHSKAIHAVNRDDVKIAINGADTKSRSLKRVPLTIDGKPLVNGKLNESLKKAQALLGEISERSDREKSKKGCEETQSVEIVNVLETDCVDYSNSERRLITELPEHDENSDIFSYDTMECEEDSYWKDMRGNGNLSMNSFDERISNEEKAHAEGTNENNGIRIVNHSNLYSHSKDDNRYHDQDLKKDTLLSVPTTETEAESFEDMVRNEGDSIEDDRSVSTSDWSESMTELIKLCEEGSRMEDLIAEDDNEGTFSRSDPGQVTFDVSRSPSKTADNISLLKNIPEYPSSDLNDVSNLAVASPKITDDNISDERIILSPSIPATLKISHEDVASQRFSPLAIPQTSYLSERGLIDEYSGMGDVTCPYHEYARRLTKEKTVTPLLEQSSTQMVLSEETSEIPLPDQSSTVMVVLEETPMKSEASISSRIDTVSNSIIAEHTTTPSEYYTITKLASTSSSTITESTGASLVVARTLSSTDEIIHSTALIKRHDQTQLIEEGPESATIVDDNILLQDVMEGKETLSVAGISALLPLDVLEKLEIVTDKLNASHAATMSLSSDSVSNSMDEKDDSSLMSDIMPMLSAESSPVAETESSSVYAPMPSSLHMATVDSNANMQQPDSITVAHLAHDLLNKSKIKKRQSKTSSVTTPKKILNSPMRATIATKATSQKKHISRTAKFLLQKKNTTIASKADENIDNRSLSSLTSTSPTHNRPSTIPKMKSPCKANSSPASLSPYKKSVRISSIPAASPLRLSSATSPQKITTRNFSIVSPRLLSANPIMKSPSPSPIKKGTIKSSIPRVSSPSPSPYKSSKRNSSIRGSSITPSTHRNEFRSPLSHSSNTFKSPASESRMHQYKIETGPLLISARDRTPGEVSLDTESTTPMSLPFDEPRPPSQRKASPARCASPVGSVNSMLGSVNSPHSASTLTVRERKKSTQDRISQYKSLKGCSNRWNPTLYCFKKPCSRCYSLASDKEKEKFEANGHHTVITLTSGGCTKLCSKFICKDDEEGVVLCRICFNAVHRPAKFLKEETCRSLEY